MIGPRVVKIDWCMHWDESN